MRHSSTLATLAGMILLLASAGQVGTGLSQEQTPAGRPVQAGDPDPSPNQTVNQSAGPASKPAAPNRIRVPARLIEGRAIHQPEPKYPKEARDSGVHGMVRLEAIIGKDGRVADVKALEGPPLLAKAAMDAVSQWRYKPVIFNGQPTEVVSEVNINFRLDEPRGRGEVETDLGTSGFSFIPPADEPTVPPTTAATDVGEGSDEAASADRARETESNHDVIRPVPIYRSDPPYTDEARKKKIQGTVGLRLDIDEEGNVSDVKVTKPLEKGLDKSAVKTSRTWKFLPAQKNGVPVPFQLNVEVMFRLF